MGSPPGVAKERCANASSAQYARGLARGTMAVRHVPPWSRPTLRPTIASMHDPFAAILGESDAAEEMRAFGRLAARVDAPVLLTGESGTGKGILAHAIHQKSVRAAHPFVAVNCAGVPESL